jgi:hypothetical protein
LQSRERRLCALLGEEKSEKRKEKKGRVTRAVEN